jgi:hypothetical protein
MEGDEQLDAGCARRRAGSPIYSRLNCCRVIGHAIPDSAEIPYIFGFG